MSGFLFPIIQYLKYFLKKEDIYSLQSPFIYKTMEGLKNHQKSNKYNFREIEKVRSGFLNNNQIIRIDDMGAGSRFFKGQRRKISSIARLSCSSKKFSLLYQYLCSITPAQTVVELGTCLGITTSYLSKVCRGRLYTFEGANTLVKLAETHLKQENKLTIVQGNIDQTLTETLQKVDSVDFALIDANHSYEATTGYFKKLLPYLHNDSIVVIGDINWSEGMNKAWKEIIQYGEVKLSVDFFECGVLFFKQGLAKEHYLL